MKIKKLTKSDVNGFCDLIVDMYSHLENLEWFSPMPYDYDNVLGMIENPRFYIIGVFDGDKLIAVSSFDYKCGKLIGKINFPPDCDTTKLVEIGFTMVHSNYRGQGIMKLMVKHLLEVALKQNFKWVFGKVHINNFASSKSLMANGFTKWITYQKEVNKSDFISLSSKEFFSEIGKQNALITLKNCTGENIIVYYDIIIKKL